MKERSTIKQYVAELKKVPGCPADLGYQVSYLVLPGDLRPRGGRLTIFRRTWPMGRWDADGVHPPLVGRDLSVSRRVFTKQYPPSEVVRLLLHRSQRRDLT